MICLSNRQKQKINKDNFCIFHILDYNQIYFISI